MLASYLDDEEVHPLEDDAREQTDAREETRQKKQTHRPRRKKTRPLKLTH